MNIDGLFSFDPLHHGVECDEGACPPNTSTAVNQEEVCLGIRMCLSHSLDEVDHGEGIGRDSMIWPCKVVKQRDLKWRSFGFSTLQMKRVIHLKCRYYGYIRKYTIFNSQFIEKS